MTRHNTNAITRIENFKLKYFEGEAIFDWTLRIKLHRSTVTTHMAFGFDFDFGEFFSFFFVVQFS